MSLVLVAAACDQKIVDVEVDVGTQEALVASSPFSALQSSTLGAPMFFSGDDADDGGHCGGSACGRLYGTAMNFIYTNSTGGSGIAVIGANGGSALSSFNSWNNPVNGGPGAPVTFLNSVPDITNADFTQFRMIYIASVSVHTYGGMTPQQLDALNGRQTDIVTNVNSLGRGVMALTEANVSNQYRWLPLTLTTSNKSHSAGIVKTPEMGAISPVTSAQLNHGCCYHSIYTGPSGFSGLQVLAFHDHNGNGVFEEGIDEVVILGGASITIQGNISLTPGTVTLPTGSTHTVTATAQDGSPPAPVGGVTVTFTVSSGPNAGTTGTAVTDGAGQASFTYTGSGGPGTDNIVASFTDGAGATQTSNTVKAVWEQVVEPPTVDAVVTGTLGTNGWYVSDVDVDWDIDLMGGTPTSPACAHGDVDADTDGVTFTCTVTTEGGTATASVTVKRDATSPTAEATLSGTESNGWYTSVVDVAWTTDDATSGVASTTCVDSTEGADGAHTISCTVTDEAGNEGEGSVEFQIDQTPPEVEFIGNAGSYDIADEISVVCTVSDPTPGSGMDEDTCADIAGPAYSFGLGTSSFTATGTDNAGNVGSGSTSFEVTASFGGLCTVVESFVSHPGTVNSLCVKLDAAARAEARGATTAQNGALGAFINEVEAQGGKKVDSAGVAILVALASALMG